MRTIFQLFKLEVLDQHTGRFIPLNSANITAGKKTKGKKNKLTED